MPKPESGGVPSVCRISWAAGQRTPIGGTKMTLECPFTQSSQGSTPQVEGACTVPCDPTSQANEHPSGRRGLPHNSRSVELPRSSGDGSIVTRLLRLFLAILRARPFPPIGSGRRLFFKYAQKSPKPAMFGGRFFTLNWAHPIPRNVNFTF